MPVKLNFGTKNCLHCNNTIQLKIRRDIERKKFCSRSCLAKYEIQNNPKRNTILKMHLLCNTPEANLKKGHPGESNGRYLEDRSKLKTRGRYELNEWRKLVFKRDNYTCQHCNQYGGKLQADHIKPYCAYPELRWDLDNGRTLCVDCHKKTDTYGSKAIKFKIEVSNSY